MNPSMAAKPNNNKTLETLKAAFKQEDYTAVITTARELMVTEGVDAEANLQPIAAFQRSVEEVIRKSGHARNFKISRVEGKNEQWYAYIKSYINPASTFGDFR